MFLPEIKLHTLLARKKAAEEGGDAAGEATTEAVDRGKTTEETIEATDLEAEDEVEDAAEDTDEPEAETDDEPEAVDFGSLLQKHKLAVPEGKDEVDYLDELLGRAAGFSQFEQERTQYQQAIQVLQQQRQQVEQYYQQLAQQQGGLTAQQSQQAQQDLGANRYEQAKLLKGWQKVPEFHEEWRNLVKEDENGHYVSIPGADPTLPQKIREYALWQQSRQNDILRNPHDFVAESLLFDPQNRVGQLVQHYVQHMLGQYQQTVSQEREQQTAHQIVREVAPWAFKNGKTPDEGYTDAGKLYAEIVSEEEADGLKDPARLHAKALKAVKRVYGEEFSKPKSEETETVAESKAKRQLNFQKRMAGRAGGRGGSLPGRNKKSPPQNDDLDPVEGVRERLIAAGLDPSAQPEF